jgi:hypothetical protein
LIEILDFECDMSDTRHVSSLRLEDPGVFLEELSLLPTPTVLDGQGVVNPLSTVNHPGAVCLRPDK